MKRFASLILALALTIGCTGGARHVAVQADVAFSQSVFALTDAALAACKNGTFTAAQCTVGGDVNTKAQQALVDVKAVTTALQDAKDKTLPKTLPDLVKSIADLQRLIGDLAPVMPAKADLAGKANAALNQVAVLLAAFTGGN